MGPLPRVLFRYTTQTYFPHIADENQINKPIAPPAAQHVYSMDVAVSNGSRGLYQFECTQQPSLCRQETWLEQPLTYFSVTVVLHRLSTRFV